MISLRDPDWRSAGADDPGCWPEPEPPHCLAPDCQNPWQKVAFRGTVDPAHDPCGAGPLPIAGGTGPGRCP